ncbi:OLC1v1013553C1 [Oldenlandia corymbosa var. corymbosa]|uniref:OLC1v1013553C1 n=1 Tax=Oldenlandia corymbosa var. corymbosa TaxID=529605 RepID=A0AAV1DZD8_OLDCO|nr:OLC1v1013553C1 [Oldenlandia corymbosa var. corymbosa]
MALSAQTPTISLHSEHLNPSVSNFHCPKSLPFSNLTQKNPHFPLKKTPNTSFFYSSGHQIAEPNSRITQLCLDNQLDEAIRILKSLQNDPQNSLDEDTFISVIRLCEFRRAWDEGCLIYEYALNFASHLSLRLGNALLSMFVRLGNLSDAWYVFGKMEDRNLFSWNVLIGGYAKVAVLFDAEFCFEPDLMTITSVISACEVLGDEKFGKALHGFAVKNYYGVDVSVGNTLIQMYSSVGNWEEAEKVFNGIELKDVISWTAMISGFESNGLPEKAVDTYKLMEMDGIVPDEITIASVLAACASLSLLDMGVKVHEHAKSTGLISYAIVANSLIDFYSKCKCIDKALEIFHEMPNKNVVSWTSIILGLKVNNRSFESLFHFRQMKLSVNPNDVTLISVLGACARIGALMCGKEIHSYVLRSGLELDGFLPNAFLDMYVKCGRMVPAWNLFNMQKQDGAAWNILLTGFAQRGQGAQAMELFGRMSHLKVEPDEITFISLLCACSKSGMVTGGLHFFESMRDVYNIVPNLKHYACVVDLLGRSGQVDDALEFIQKMPIKPDAAIWGALLNSCRIHRCLDVGEIAARHLYELDEEFVEYYVLLCNFYSECGKWDDVASLQRMLREKGVTVDPGCSWVEVKGQVHAFLTGENFHPQIKEMNSVLEGFYDKMKAEGLSDPQTNSLNEDSKAEVFCGHSERLAIAFALINTVPGMPIWVTKNLYMCRSCHSTVKFISKVVRREISLRDTEHFHHFKDGKCSCGDEGFQGAY